MGSGAGEATKPSNSLIRARVAAFMGGPVQARGASGDERVVAKRAESVRRQVEKCMVVD
jgi:hypothetical protein